jgi:hypothetical protein
MVMRWLGTTFHGAAMQATDGAIGELADLLFDDQTWQVRWLVVDTGRWLNGRRVMIHPASLARLDMDSASLKVQLTRSQIRNSPLIDTEEHISTEMERSLHRYYGHDPVACGALFCREPIARAAGSSFGRNHGSVASMAARQRRNAAQPHLRSLAEVEGYRVRATDGESSFLNNVIVDDEAWCVKSLVIDVPSWFTVRHVVVSVAMVEWFSWPERCIRLALTREAIKCSPRLQHALSMGPAYQVLRRAYRDWAARDPMKATPSRPQT